METLKNLIKEFNFFNFFWGKAAELIVLFPYGEDIHFLLFIK